MHSCMHACMQPSFHPSVHPSIHPSIQQIFTSILHPPALVLGAIRRDPLSVQINYFGGLEKFYPWGPQGTVLISFSMDSLSSADHSFVFVLASFSEHWPVICSAMADHSSLPWLHVILLHRDSSGPWSSSEGSCWGFQSSPPLTPPWNRVSDSED